MQEPSVCKAKFWPQAVNSSIGSHFHVFACLKALPPWLYKPFRHRWHLQSRGHQSCKQPSNAVTCRISCCPYMLPCKPRPPAFRPITRPSFYNTKGPRQATSSMRGSLAAQGHVRDQANAYLGIENEFCALPRYGPPLSTVVRTMVERANVAGPSAIHKDSCMKPSKHNLRANRLTSRPKA